MASWENMTYEISKKGVNVAHEAMERTSTMAALFGAIARLAEGKDGDVRQLAIEGQGIAQELHNDLDVFRANVEM
jgi:hypothetical protein